MTLNWAVGEPASAPLRPPPSMGFYPPMCPIIAERLQLSDRRFLLWLDFVSLDVQSLLLRKKGQVAGPSTPMATPPSLESSTA